MGKIKIELPSYAKFAKYQEKMDKKKAQLQSRINENKEQIEALTKEYAVGFGEDKDLTEVSNKLKHLKDLNKQLHDEIDIVDGSDYREKELAKAIYDEYKELESEILAERTRLFEQAEQAQKNAKEAIRKLDSDYQTLAVEFDTKIGEQLREIVDHLEINEGAKVTFVNKINSTLGMSGYSSFAGILNNRNNNPF